MVIEFMERRGGHLGQGEYILGTDSIYSYNFCIRKTRVSTDHWMILAELKGGGELINHKYCNGMNSWPIVALKRGPMREEDTTFNNLKRRENISELETTCVLTIT